VEPLRRAHLILPFGAMPPAATARVLRDRLAAEAIGFALWLGLLAFTARSSAWRPCRPWLTAP
jgi:hypothetical protein